MIREIYKYTILYNISNMMFMYDLWQVFYNYTWLDRYEDCAASSFCDLFLFTRVMAAAPSQIWFQTSTCNVVSRKREYCKKCLVPNLTFNPGSRQFSNIFFKHLLVCHIWLDLCRDCPTSTRYCRLCLHWGWLRVRLRTPWGQFFKSVGEKPQEELISGWR